MDMSGSPLMCVLLAVCFVWAVGVTSWFCISHMGWAELHAQLQKRIDGYQLALNAQKKRSATAWVKQRDEYETALSNASLRLWNLQNEHREASGKLSIAETAADCWKSVAEDMSSQITALNEEMSQALLVARDPSGDPLTAVVRNHVRRMVVDQLAEASGVPLAVTDDGRVVLADGELEPAPEFSQWAT